MRWVFLFVCVFVGFVVACSQGFFGGGGWGFFRVGVCLFWVVLVFFPPSIYCSDVLVA